MIGHVPSSPLPCPQFPRAFSQPGLGQDLVDRGLGPADLRLEQGHFGVEDVGVQGDALLEPLARHAEVLLGLADGLAGDADLLAGPGQARAGTA